MTRLAFIGLAARVLLGALLMWAGLSKLTESGMSPEGPQAGWSVFASEVRDQGVVPEYAASSVALAVIGAELVLGGWLLLHIRPVMACWATIALLSIFSLYLVVLLATKGDQQCACFGARSTQLASTGLFRNALLMFMAVLGTVPPAKRRSASVSLG